MKYTLALLLIIPLLSNSQVDSSKLKTSGIVFKGKDLDMVADIVRADPMNFPDLDSLIKLKYRNPPANTADVTLDSIPNRQLLKIALRMKSDNMCVLGNVFKNVDAELRLHGTAWIISRLDKDNYVTDAALVDRRKRGQRYGQKKDDEDQ